MWDIFNFNEKAERRHPCHQGGLQKEDEGKKEEEEGKKSKKEEEEETSEFDANEFLLGYNKGALPPFSLLECCALVTIRHSVPYHIPEIPLIARFFPDPKASDSPLPLLHHTSSEYLDADAHPTSILQHEEFPLC